MADMNTLFLLIVLSKNAAGDINASFVNTGTLTQCQQKAVMVEEIFNAAKIPVIESRCIESKLRFSNYGHGLSSGKIRSYYVITFDESMVQITIVPDWPACMQLKKSAGHDVRAYCTSSAQFVHGQQHIRNEADMHGGN